MQPEKDLPRGATLMIWIARLACWFGLAFVLYAIGHDAWQYQTQEQAVNDRAIEQSRQLEKAFQEWEAGRAERQREMAQYQECLRESIAAQKAINAKLHSRLVQEGRSSR